MALKILKTEKPVKTVTEWFLGPKNYGYGYEIITANFNRLRLTANPYLVALLKKTADGSHHVAVTDALFSRQGAQWRGASVQPAMF